MTPPGSVLPWCPNGDYYRLEGCICSHEDPHLDANTIDRANWFASERLREAVRKGGRPLDKLAKRRRARP